MFLLPREPERGDPRKGARSGCTGHGQGLGPGYERRWEATSQDTWYTDDGLWRTLAQLGHGAVVHCRRCDYIGMHPDGRGDCSAHTVAKGEDLRGVWYWGCKTMCWLDKSLPRITGSGDPALTQLDVDKYVDQLVLPIDIAASKYIAVDALTGTRKTHWFKDHLAHEDRGPGAKVPWMIVVFRVSLVEFYLNFLGGPGFVDYRKISLPLVTSESCPRLAVCIPSVYKLGRCLDEGMQLGGSFAGAWRLCLDEVGQTRGMMCSSDHSDKP